MTIPQENGPLHQGRSRKDTDVGSQRLRLAAMVDEERLQALDGGREKLESEFNGFEIRNGGREG